MKKLLIFLILPVLFSLNFSKISAKEMASKVETTYSEKDLAKQIDKLSQLIQNLTPEDQKNISSEPASLQSSSSGSSRILAVFSKTTDGFKFLLDKADRLLSKKFFIASVVTLGPAFALYCKHFDPELIQKALKLVTRTAIQGGGKLGAPVVESIVEETASVVLGSKKAILELAGMFLVLSMFKETVVFVGQQTATVALPGTIKIAFQWIAAI